MQQDRQALMVLPLMNFNQDEYEYTRRALEDNGIRVMIAASELGVCTGVSGITIDADFGFDSIDPDNYDGIVFIGGPGVDAYFSNDKALELANKFFNANKTVGAICWAPVILAKAGILSRRKTTGWDGAKADFENAGAIYTGDKVTVDDVIVTADGPESALKFGQQVAEMINK